MTTCECGQVEVVTPPGVNVTGLRCPQCPTEQEIARRVTSIRALEAEEDRSADLDDRCGIRHQRDNELRRLGQLVVLRATESEINGD